MSVPKVINNANISRVCIRRFSQAEYFPRRHAKRPLQNTKRIQTASLHRYRSDNTRSTNRCTDQHMRKRVHTHRPAHTYTHA